MSDRLSKHWSHDSPKKAGWYWQAERCPNWAAGRCYEHEHSDETAYLAPRPVRLVEHSGRVCFPGESTLLGTRPPVPVEPDPDIIWSRRTFAPPPALPPHPLARLAR